MKLSGRVWSGEAGWGCASSVGAAGVMVSKSLLGKAYWREDGRILGGTRLPRNLIMGTRC